MVLGLFSDVPSVKAPAIFNHAEQSFLHGYLEDSQREAEQGYRRFLYSDPVWARKFQLLRATAMAWRNLNEDALAVLADDRISWTSKGDEVQRLAIQVGALKYLHRLPEADQALARADQLCGAEMLERCGDVLAAHGLLHLERGDTVEAEKSFRASLEFARAHKDGLLEATALQNLGSVYARQEHHDEAIAYYRLSLSKATETGAGAVQESALGSEGSELYSLGNSEKALGIFEEAERRAASIGDTGYEVLWTTLLAKAYLDTGQLALAERADLRAIDLARRINKKQGIIDASEDLAEVYVDEGRPRDAERVAGEALTLSQQTGNQPDILYCHMLQGEAAALQHDWPRADGLLHEVALAPESQTRMRWTAQHTLATMYEAQGQMGAAEQSYKAAIALVEGARADLKQELSQLTFLTNAAHIYDDYIHFLVAQGRGDGALEAADWSRARTLQQGLGLISTAASPKTPPLRAKEIARKTNSTLLFYWMGEKQSYLWAVSPEETTLVTLPAKNEIVTRMQRYRKTLLALKDPLRESYKQGDNSGQQGDKDGRELYEMLVAPVAGIVAEGRPVVLFTDGEMSQFNFETLLVGSPAPHYWIEDATLSSAPSIRLLAAKRGAARAAHDRLLLLGDAQSTDPALPHLAMAELEVRKVQAKFSPDDEAVFSGPKATPLAYLASKPGQFSYIHFVAHGAASSTDPLESAVVLSRDSGGEDSYKLYAREILRHPITARLVTISACNSSGTKSYAGEGVVGLSWAFLRAGAHNTIGALWDVSDASTPELMDRLYTGLQQNKPPAVALREAKLSLLHSQGNFGRPFYWAPFQLYSGR
jgi:CHAT domain-containing protein/tetratricopeptide (TPR) repeat protein